MTQPDDMKTLIREQARAWARELAVGKPTQATAQALRRWCALSPDHAQAWRHASEEWRSLREVADTFRREVPAPVPPRRVSRRWMLGASLSGAVALTGVAIVRPPLGLWPSWSELGADYRTAAGEQRDIQLAPTVQLALNTRTSVAVSQADGMPRVQLIAGECAVSSGPRSGVQIVAGDARLSVMGGAAQARRLADGWTRVVCTAGEARLDHPARQVVLAAGQETRYDARQVSEPAALAARDVPAWREGVLVFQNTPLDIAVEEINRYQRSRIVVTSDALAQRRISGRFRIESLDEPIALIQTLYDAKVLRVGGLVLLS